MLIPESKTRVVLITTEANSIFIKEYVENVLLGRYDVLLVTNECRKYRRFYRENGVKVVVWNPPKTFALRPAGRISDKIRRDDIIHVHYVEPNYLRYLFVPWIKCKKRILTYWGSDLLRLPMGQIKSIGPFLYTADSLVIMNENMRPKMQEAVGKWRWNRIKCIDFGNSIFDEIDKAEKIMTADDCRKRFELPTDKITVAVGYNPIREQQHLEMMQEVVKLPEELLSQMFFVFHFGYGQRETAYINRLYKLLEENNLQYIVLEKFLEKQETAILRLCMDVFLYGQTTDALSASMLEYMYAGAVLIKPAWLKYAEFEDYDYHEYKKFEELAPLLERLVRQGIVKTEHNRKLLKGRKSWDVYTPQWRALYGEKPNGKRGRKISLAKWKYHKRK